MPSSLYICYFGIDQPLVQTQVLPYLRELVKAGYEMSLLTFEPGEVDESKVRRALADDGIEWHALRYHKRPSVPATIFDIGNAVRFIRKLMKANKFDILHARSHVPMMMAASARKASSHKPRLLFDIRGFLPEEYVDAGVWPDGGRIYRGVKRAEEWMMEQADGYVVLTESARRELFPESAATGVSRDGKPVAVIPCCVDLGRRFSGNRDAERLVTREKLGIGADRLVFTHVGALGGLYLTEQIADLLGVAKSIDRSTFGLFLTQSDPGHILPLLEKKGFSEFDYFVGTVPASEVENYLYASDIGLSFVKASYATKSRSPTKIPEYLAAGLPVIANAGVGDVDEQITDWGLGVVVENFEREEFAQAISRVRQMANGPEITAGLIDVAFERFDLKAVGGPRYVDLYERILNP
jgi:glycosyltransferase involved in cell wall biosynthesis